MHELIKLSARQVVNLLKKGEVSPLELIDAAGERIAEVEGLVNAMPTLCLDRARQRAKRLMEKPPADPPPHFLYGLPIAIKDLTDVAGVRTTYGSPIFDKHKPERSDYLVQILEANGAIVIGKTNTPEFGAGANTFNEVFGQTLNPWNTAMTCGGSSGGSAVAVATGETWLAQGSDLGGSLRIPAGFCSVVGLRPSPGRVPCGPKPILFDALPVHGPMARNVADTALMLDAQTGRHPGDPNSLPRPRIPYINVVDHPVKPKRIGFSVDLGIAPVNYEVKDICTRAADSLSDLDIQVEEACPDLKGAEEIFQILRASLFAYRFAPLLKEHRTALKPEVIWNIEKGLALTADEIGRAERGKAALFYRIRTFFKKYDLLVCPTVITPPFDVNIRYLEDLEGVKFDSYISWLILTFAITLTACPAISIPCGFTKAGLPVGLQFVAPPQRDDMVLSAATLFEQLHGLDKLTPIDPRKGQLH
jgi:amidase